MIKIISIEQKSEWDHIVKSFSNYDVYYLSGYSKGFQINGDGEPFLLYYESAHIKGISVMMKRTLSTLPFLSEHESFHKYNDIVSPYGYGGFIFEGDIASLDIEGFNKEYTQILLENNVVSSFVRFHPILNNSVLLKDVYNIVDLGHTIHIDLASKQYIMENMKSKDRNTIRRAIKSGVEIKHSKDPRLIASFIKIYNATMKNDSASEYYYFDEPFYDSLFHDLYDNFEVFYAELENVIIAISLIIYANNQMHYHLSGSVFEFRKFAPTNLLLFKAAEWGVENGFDSFHLGGGLGSTEDSLFKFKKSFNKKSVNQFSIGTKIINEKVYSELVKIREESDNTFNKQSNFFPLYRS